MEINKCRYCFKCKIKDDIFKIKNNNRAINNIRY